MIGKDFTVAMSTAALALAFGDARADQVINGIVVESTVPVAQLGIPPLSTHSAYGVGGTDLGVPVQLGNYTYFLNGDTVNNLSMTVQNGNSDSMAYVPTADLDELELHECVYNLPCNGVNPAPDTLNPLDFQLIYKTLPGDPSKYYETEILGSPNNVPFPGYTYTYECNEQAVETPNLMSWLVPTGVFSIDDTSPANDDRIYMFYNVRKGNCGNTYPMLKTILTVSRSNAQTLNPLSFTELYEVSAPEEDYLSHENADPPKFHTSDSIPPVPYRLNQLAMHDTQICEYGKGTAAGATQCPLGGLGKFSQVATVIVKAAELSTPLPVAAGVSPDDDVALFFGASWRFRNSNLYIAAVPLDLLESGRKHWWFFNKTSGWSDEEQKASPMLTSWTNEEWCAEPNPAHTIGEFSVARISEARKYRYVVLYNGGCPDVIARFTDDPLGAYSQEVPILSKQDDIFGFGLPNSSGLYAPYIVQSRAETDYPETDELTITFNISTWIPYTYHLVRTKVTVPATSP